MFNNEFVSVIIPVYNGEKHICRAIQSVLNQTYRNIQIVVINDGSTDKTEDIVRGLSDENPCIVLISTENFGVSHARNIGIDNSIGDYLLFLDSDDEILPDSIEVLLECCKKNNLDIVHGKNIRIPDGMTFANNVEDSLNLIIYENENVLINAIYDLPETHSSCAKLFKKSSVKNCRFPEGRRCHEDSFFIFLCVCEMVRFGVLNKTVAVFYTVDNSASRQMFSEKHYDILYLANKKYDIICNRFLSHRDIGINILIKAHMAFLKCTLTGNNIKSIEKESINFLKKNKRYFIPVNNSDKKWFYVLSNGLYYIYKYIHNILR